MAKKVQVRIKQRNDHFEVQDAVLFMAAYDIHEIKKKFSPLGFLKKSKGLLEQFHLSSVSTGDSILTRSGKIEYSLQYDSLTQHSAYNFDTTKINDKKLAEAELKDLRWMLPLRHAERLILGDIDRPISFCLNMESFLVQIDDEELQVDPLIFCMNGLLFISYELIHYNSGIPFTAKEVYGRKHNYNIQPVKKLRYFNLEIYTNDCRKISDIIFDNAISFLDKLLKHKYCFGTQSFVHNTFVLSNDIYDIDAYFQFVLGADLPDFHAKNISPQSEFQYYSTEYLGVATGINSSDSSHVLFECLVLEALKMCLCLGKIVDYEVTETLNDLLNRQIYFEQLHYPKSAPIITLNAIDNAQKTPTYKRYEKAVQFKINALKLVQERQRISNSRFLNVLLYILAMLGGLQVLDILEQQFQISFVWGLIVEILLFGSLGLIWYLKEKNE